MTNEEIIALLKQDMRDEHAAIVQYLNHAYGMGEGEITCEIEGVARDEMRHLNWLARAIVQLGGTPTLERGRMRTGGDGVSAWLQNDVLQEGDAIKQYREHIALIDNPRIKRLLEHILADEISHQQSFHDFADEAEDEGLKDIRGNRADEAAGVINWGIGHEYTVILQYLFHGYLAEHPEIKRQMEDQAINEMQHLGWLAENLASAHGTPVIEHTPVDQSVDQREMLRADISIEKEVSKRYRAAAEKLIEPDLKKLLRRIADQEDYHAAVFEDLLNDEAA
jgi:bacterioferritin